MGLQFTTAPRTTDYVTALTATAVAHRCCHKYYVTAHTVSPRITSTS